LLNPIKNGGQASLDPLGNLLINVATGAVSATIQGVIPVHAVTATVQGTVPVSMGVMTVADTGGVADILTQMLYELRAMRTAIVALVTESGTYIPADFEPNSYSDAVVTENTTS
jgi:hypothetical protein